MHGLSFRIPKWLHHYLISNSTTKLFSQPHANLYRFITAKLTGKCAQLLLRGESTTRLAFNFYHAILVMQGEVKIEPPLMAYSTSKFFHEQTTQVAGRRHLGAIASIFPRYLGTTTSVLTDAFSSIADYHEQVLTAFCRHWFMKSIHRSQMGFAQFLSSGNAIPSVSDHTSSWLPFPRQGAWVEAEKPQ